MNNKPYIYFHEELYKEYPSLPEKIKAFKEKAKGFIYGYMPRLYAVIERLEEGGFESHLHYFDIYHNFDEGKKDEEKVFYKGSMEFIELRELAEEFIKEGSQNCDHFDIVDMVNKIFSYYPKEEYDKVYSMYHRLYKH